jgi:hypothetical protein
VRVFLLNSFGEFYGDEISFTTNESITVPDAPIITCVTAGDGQVDITFDAPTNDGGSTITGYTTTSSPGNFTGSIAQAGSGTITVTGLSNGTAYTFTITATNELGTSSPSSASNSVTPQPPPPPPQVGDYREGGVVFYVAPTPTDLNGDGILDQGLVCALEDQSSGTEWGCLGTDLNGSNSSAVPEFTDIGKGKVNTSFIVNNCGEAGIAAKICDNYSVTVGCTVYDDWFLPSKEELNLMYQNKATIDANALANGGSGFVSAKYWSSSELFNNAAFIRSFQTGVQDYWNKNNPGLVRAVRAF